MEGVAPVLFEFCIVSKWMSNGDMMKYIQKYPAVNRLELVRLTHLQWRPDPVLTGL